MTWRPAPPGMPSPKPTLTLALAALLAGCLSGTPAADVGTVDAPPEGARLVDTTAGCAWFCEPSVAVDGEGRWFVLGDALRVSEDEGTTWGEAGVPPVPRPNAFQTDGLIQAAPDGTLWYSALVASCPLAVSCNPFVLYGVQVARATAPVPTPEDWESVFLSAPTHPRGVGADRQWLSFGPDGLVCVSFQHVGAAFLSAPVPLPRPSQSDLRVSCAKDPGAFPDFVSAVDGQPVSIINGRPSFDASGAMFIPHFRYDGGARLEVSVSTDGGRTFEARGVGGVGAWFPALAVSPDGTLHVAWNDDGTLRHASSADQGASWSEPEALTLPKERVVSSPWLEAGPGGVTVAWFTQEGSEETNRLEAWRGGARTVLASGLENGAYRYAGTDFAHFALDASGRALVLVPDLGAEETRLAVVPAPTG